MLRIKVGQMPGRLSEVVFEQGQRAIELFELAGVEISNHEIRLDGNKIDKDTRIEGGNLLVAMKMIKGNTEAVTQREVYVSELSVEEIENITSCVMPTTLEKEQVTDIGSDMVMVLDFVLEKDIFNSIYTLKEAQEEVEDFIFEPITRPDDVEEVKVNTCNNTYIMNKLNELRDRRNFYWSQYKEVNVQVELLEDIVEHM